MSAPSYERRVPGNAETNPNEPERCPDPPFRLELYNNFIVYDVKPEDALGLVYWAIRSTGADSDLQSIGCRWRGCRYSAQGYVEFGVTAYVTNEEGQLIVNVQCWEGDRLAFRDVFRGILEAIRQTGKSVRVPSCDSPSFVRVGCQPTSPVASKSTHNARNSEADEDSTTCPGSTPLEAQGTTPNIAPAPPPPSVTPCTRRTEIRLTEGVEGYVVVTAETSEHAVERRLETLAPPRRICKGHASDTALRPLVAMITGPRLDEQEQGARSLSCLSASATGRRALSTEFIIESLARLVRHVSPHHAHHACVYAVFTLANVSELEHTRWFIAKSGVVPRLLRLTASIDPSATDGLLNLELRRQGARILTNVGASHVDMIMSALSGRERDYVERWISRGRHIADERLRSHVLRLKETLEL